MRVFFILLIMGVIFFSGCKHKEGPVVINDFSNSLELEAVFADGHKVMGLLVGGRTAWLCHDKSMLVALTAKVEGHEAIKIDKEILKKWHTALLEGQVLVITFSEKKVSAEGRIL